ncbi:hypothetical protein L288_17125 [Sphingobium quisquiliarum P25]|uniref:Uncharacterized protein n=1 Tax=Sphingobium quisquiliarum P25 TaxID=1329909 RepID=T0GPM8_9SPHN|nr:hypothetical protein [Sphingobium quisquiliarum]EQB01943.1 hypothetical protein L288_17125 [Sphingobium quisquiliarum P25]
MEVYAAMVDRMDQNIGRVMATLKRLGRSAAIQEGRAFPHKGISVEGKSKPPIVQLETVAYTFLKDSLAKNERERGCPR